MKKIYLSIICLVAAVSLLLWGYCVAADVFRSPVFSSFWWLNYGNAHSMVFVAIAIGGAALLFGINFWPFHKDKQ